MHAKASILYFVSNVVLQTSSEMKKLSEEDQCTFWKKKKLVNKTSKLLKIQAQIDSLLKKIDLVNDGMSSFLNEMFYFGKAESIITFVKVSTNLFVVDLT